MTRVYRLTAATNTYRSLIPDPETMTPQLREMLRLLGTPSVDRWSPPKVMMLDPALKVPDVWRFGPYGLAFPPAVAEQLGPILTEAGELLPLPFDGQTFQFLNFTPRVDCLDPDATTWSMTKTTPPRRIQAMQVAFIEERLPPATVFKTKGSAATLCVDGRSDGEFKSAIETAGLEGLRFDLLWDSEDPAALAAQTWP